MTATRGLMRYRATIERKTLVPDGGGGSTPEWAPVATGVPCWAWMKSGTGGFSSIAQEGGKPTVVDARHVTVPLDTDIIVGDRVTVRDRRGTRVVFEAMILDAVGARPDHLHCLARTVT